MSIWHIIMLSAEWSLHRPLVARPVLALLRSTAWRRASTRGCRRKPQTARLFRRAAKPFSTANRHRARSRLPKARLGTASPQMIDAIMRGLARAHEADRTGDLNACRRALSEMESLLID